MRWRTYLYSMIREDIQYCCCCCGDSIHWKLFRKGVFREQFPLGIFRYARAGKVFEIFLNNNDNDDTTSKTIIIRLYKCYRGLIERSGGRSIPAVVHIMTDSDTDMHILCHKNERASTRLEIKCKFRMIQLWFERIRKHRNTHRLAHKFNNRMCDAAAFSYSTCIFGFT